MRIIWQQGIYCEEKGVHHRMKTLHRQEYKATTVYLELFPDGQLILLTRRQKTLTMEACMWPLWMAHSTFVVINQQPSERGCFNLRWQHFTTLHVLTAQAH